MVAVNRQGARGSAAGARLATLRMRTEKLAALAVSAGEAASTQVQDWTALLAPCRAMLAQVEDQVPLGSSGREVALLSQALRARRDGAAAKEVVRELVEHGRELDA